MARQSSHRPETDEPVESGGSTEPEQTETEATASAADRDGAATTGDRSLWEDVRIDPVEIALPAGSGFTLRAYRPASQVTPTDVEERDQDDVFASRARPVEVEEDDDAVVILDEELAEQFAEEDDEAESGRGRKSADGDEALADEDESDKEEDEETEDEEVPAFLTHRGRLLLFKSPESLVTFVRSGAPHDLAELDTWDQLVERIEPADVVALDEDSYELDLVVENLRGGHDVWDATLLIEAGEVARDLAYALRLPAVLDMLSSGSSLDDLDEALRATVGGGLGGFRGRRRLKKIGAQTASLGWRTIIGKISAAVDWRD
ncbi:DNA primase [Plantactinospora sp. CA-290183]|uniref:DNA primase n=1 Tax=Plantactinospora sp. CA-290183 TaxID=3240006 RepID=UPI003D9028ED